jgi:predicted dehydrogenase
MRSLKVALVGCGFVADGHLKAWSRLKNVKVVAVCDVKVSLAKSAALSWGIPHYYDSYLELLDKEEIDVVDICTPPNAHVDLAVEAMERGINVILEKPMTMTVAEAKRIIEYWKKTSVKTGVIHNWLFNSPVLKATSLVQNGLLGEVYSVEVETFNTKDDVMASNQNHWCHKYPGGRFSEMLTHPIYLIRHFLGENIKIAAVHTSKIGSYPWMKSDELAVIFNVGRKIGRSYASFNSPRDAVYISIYGKEGIIKLELINSILTFLPKRKLSRFSKGFDSIKQAGQIINWVGKNAFKVFFRTWMSGHDEYIKRFAESIISDSEPPVSAIDGMAVVKILEEVCKKIAGLENLIYRGR